VTSIEQEKYLRSKRSGHNP